MYNTYLNDNFYHTQFKNTPADVVIEDDGNVVVNHNKSMFSGLFNNINFPEITTETLILFAVIFFSIYDDFDMDLLIIIGVLFLLGL